jgi:hypothetical protein
MRHDQIVNQSRIRYRRVVRFQAASITHRRAARLRSAYQGGPMYRFIHRFNAQLKSLGLLMLLGLALVFGGSIGCFGPLTDVILKWVHLWN